MIQVLIWWLENSPRWLGCLAEHGRSQQEVLRSSVFHSGHVWCSQAALPDKLNRLVRRAGADTITLLHGNGQTQLALYRQLPAPAHDPCQLYQTGQRLHQRTGQHLLQGLVDIGRALLR